MAKTVSFHARKMKKSDFTVTIYDIQMNNNYRINNGKMHLLTDQLETSTSKLTNITTTSQFECRKGEKSQFSRTKSEKNEKEIVF